jgi:hypothetical protein
LFLVRVEKLVKSIIRQIIEILFVGREEFITHLVNVLPTTQGDITPLLILDWWYLYIKVGGYYSRIIVDLSFLQLSLALN